MSTLVQGRIGIVTRFGSGTQAAQLSASSHELLAQFGQLVLQPALGGHQFGAHLARTTAAKAMDMPLRGSSCIVPPRRARQLDDVVCAPVPTHALQFAPQLGDLKLELVYRCRKFVAIFLP